MGTFLVDLSDRNVAACPHCGENMDGACDCIGAVAMRDVAQFSKVRRFSQGDTVSAQCDGSGPVGYVLEGILKLVKSLPDGRANIIGLVGTAEFFGQYFGSSAEFSIEAATDVVLNCFDRAAFEDYLAKNPVIEHRIHLQVLHQLDTALERIAVLACQSSMERLTTYLGTRLLEAEMNGGGDARSQVQIQVNRRDFAAYLGTTVETISRNLQALSRSGIIEIVNSGRFNILKRQALFAAAGQDEDDLRDAMRSRRVVEPVFKQVPAEKGHWAARSSNAPKSILRKPRIGVAHVKLAAIFQSQTSGAPVATGGSGWGGERQTRKPS
jgi:CRP/FNR family transcriptional regulator